MSVFKMKEYGKKEKRKKRRVPLLDRKSKVEAGNVCLKLKERETQKE